MTVGSRLGINARRVRQAGLAIGLLALVAPVVPSAHAAGSSTISGTAFQDTDRDGAVDANEGRLAGHRIYLFDATGANTAAAQTDSAGRYAFTGLTDGDYTVSYEYLSWTQIRADWAPTTTGSVKPTQRVRLAGTATADFGWRPIARSTDKLSPYSTHTGPTGLTVKSYDDVVPARSVHDRLAAGSLIGAEASTVTVLFDWGSHPVTSSMVGGSPGTYTGYRATVSISWTLWLDEGDNPLFHEYGHAWSLYYDYIVQQDGTLSRYLSARGVAGDPRIGSSYAWDPREMIAEDYRQLFGSAEAAAYPQLNTDLPRASSVAGLGDFLRTTFRGTQAAPSPTASPSPSPTASPTAAPQPSTSPSPSASPTPTSKRRGGGK